jgi:hypothetical protein
MYISVDVDIDEILEDLTDEEVQNLYDERFANRSRFAGSPGSGFWKGLYEDRMRMTKEDFLKHIDKIIMDYSGRIICD